MKQSTPDFVGLRLKQAREARGLMGTTLAELVEVSPSSITQYERGKHKPTPENLRRIAEVLNLPVDYFLLPTEPPRLGSETFYRCMASATAGARRRGERRLEWLQRIVQYARKSLALPRVDFPESPGHTEPVILSQVEVEQFATAARRHWGLGDGPISDVTLLLENHGAVITRGMLGASTLDAFSRWMWDDGTPYFFLGADKGGAGRNRFNLAHELGHTILHRSIPGGHLGRREVHKLLEQQAHRFASAFLMPAESFVEEVHGPTLDALLSLKPRWNVSVAAMLKRILDLRLISEEQYRRLRIMYSKRKWTRVEPLDKDTPVEQPRVLRRSIELLVERGIIGRGQLMSDLRISRRDIEELCCLEPGYLLERQPPVDVLPFARRGVGESAAAQTKGGGKVIEFPIERRYGQ